MSDEIQTQLALLNQLDPEEGFAGCDTARLMETALNMAGFATLDGVSFLEEPARQAQDLPDAWVTLGNKPREDSLTFCRERSIPHHLLDPALSDKNQELLQHSRTDAMQACCFGPKADRLNQNSEAAPAAFYFSPFLDPEPYFTAQRDAGALRQNLSQRHGLPLDKTWIFLSVPPGSSDEAICSIFETLARLYIFEWNLIVSAAEKHRNGISQLLSGISGKSRYLINAHDPQERLSFLAASDLCLSVERSGGSVMDLLEALASGLAIVANKSPETEEIVENGVTGRLSAAGNPASLSNDLTFLLRHDNFLQSYRDNTRRQVTARHDILVAAQTLRNVINSSADSKL